MIYYIDIEHVKKLQDNIYHKKHVVEVKKNAHKFEKLSGETCPILHYLFLDRDMLMNKSTKAIMISGNAADWDDYDLDEFGELFKIIKESNIPTIGFCGGHQLMALAYNEEVTHMRPLKSGEEDKDPDSHPGIFTERGFTKVRIVKHDSLFDKLSDEITVPQWHCHQVEALPQGFELLAGSKECRIEAMKYKDRPIYGLQFHPEAFDEQHPDGKKILLNFFKMAMSKSRNV